MAKERTKERLLRLLSEHLGFNVETWVQAAKQLGYEQAVAEQTLRYGQMIEESPTERERRFRGALQNLLEATEQVSAIDDYLALFLIQEHLFIAGDVFALALRAARKGKDYSLARRIRGYQDRLTAGRRELLERRKVRKDKGKKPREILPTCRPKRR